MENYCSNVKDIVRRKVSKEILKKLLQNKNPQNEIPAEHVEYLTGISEGKPIQNPNYSEVSSLVYWLCSKYPHAPIEDFEELFKSSSEYVILYPWETKLKGLVVSMLKKIHAQAENKGGEFCSRTGKWHKLPPQKLIAWYLNQNGYLYKDKLWFKDGGTIPVGVLKANTRIVLCEHPYKLTRSSIDDLLKTYMYDVEKSQWDGAINAVSYDPRCSNYAKEAAKTWVEAVATHHKNADKNLLAECVLHWIWCVKRKMLERPTQNELALWCVGTTNAGKTTALQKLVAPVSAVSSSVSLGEMTSEKGSSAYWYDNAVLVSDEAAGRDIDFEKLKSLITSSSQTTRTYYTQESSKATVRASLCLSTNFRVGEIVPNITKSARRWLELRVEGTCNQKSINSIDYVRMWCGVDENAESPLKGDRHKVWVEFAEANLARGSDSSLTEFFESQLVCGDQWTPFKDLYDEYVASVEGQPLSAPKFSKNLNSFLRSLNLTKNQYYKRKGVDKVVYYKIEINQTL